jgi:peptidyl-prolyl cis-trans isomerase D
MRFHRLGKPARNGHVMLQEMRKYTKSWIANIFLGVLALSFVSWGVGDMVSGRTDTSVAKVGGTVIDRSDFSRDFQNAMKQEGARRGEATLTADEARKLGLGDAVLESKISQTALDNMVKKLGLTVSDAQVVAMIQRIPSFSGLTGQFDRRVFLQAIERFGYSEQGFLELIRADIARSQLSRAIESGFTLPPGYAKLLFAYFFETRAADYIVVEDKALGTIPTPPDATLQAYIKAHADQFSTPEYRDVTYAWLTPADVIAQVKVTDDQIKQAYDENRGTYIVPEKRDVEQINFNSEAAAKAAFDKASKGGKFEDVTNEKGEKPVAQPALTPQDLDAGAAKAVFAAAKDAVIPPQKLPSGKWAVFKVTAITPGINRTLDQVKEEIRSKLALDGAISKLTDVSNAYTDQSSKGLNLTEAAKAVGMHTGRVQAIDAQGLGPDGKKTAAPDDPEFRELVFRTEAGEEGDPQVTKQNAVYVVAVSGSTPPKLKSLDQVRDRALAAWTAQERARLLKQKAEQLVAQANKEGSLDGAAKAIGATIQKSPRILHNFNDDTFGPALVQALFQVGPGKTAVGPRAKGGGYVVARVTGIVHPQINEKDPRFLMAMQQLGTQAGGSVSESYIAEQRAEQKVVYNRKNIDSVQGGEPQ